MTSPIEDCAAMLLAAYSDRLPVAPPRKVVEGLDLDGAYAIQLAQVRHWRAAGRRVRGHKVGLTSRAMQEQFGVGQPDYGHLLDTMFYPESSEIPVGAFFAPRAEPEIAFVLDAPLRGPGLHAGDVLRATAFVVPALEIIDSRVQDWDITLLDTIADNASSGGVVLGGGGASPGAVDLRSVGCTLLHNGRVAEFGTGAAVLGDPASAVAWLANTLAGRDLTLEAGSVVLSGSCTRAVPLAPGDSVSAVFDGLGTVSVALAAPPEEGSN